MKFTAADAEYEFHHRMVGRNAYPPNAPETTFTDTKINYISIEKANRMIQEWLAEQERFSIADGRLAYLIPIDEKP